MAFVNEGNWDRALRVIIGVVLLVLGWGGFVSGTLGTVFKFLGFLPLITGLSGWCALYTLLGIRTNKAD
jgi:ammonia channel protein AmtB